MFLYRLTFKNDKFSGQKKKVVNQDPEQAIPMNMGERHCFMQ